MSAELIKPLNHSMKTAQTITLALGAVSRVGVKPAESRALLPAGITSVQELNENQAKKYLIDLRTLYIDAMRSKRNTGSEVIQPSR